MGSQRLLALGRQLRLLGVHALGQRALDGGVLTEAVDVVLAGLGHAEARRREAAAALLGKLFLVRGQAGANVALHLGLTELLHVGLAGLLPGHLDGLGGRRRGLAGRSRGGFGGRLVVRVHRRRDGESDHNQEREDELGHRHGATLTRGRRAGQPL